MRLFCKITPTVFFIIAICVLTPFNASAQSYLIAEDVLISKIDGMRVAQAAEKVQGNIIKIPDGFHNITYSMGIVDKTTNKVETVISNIEKEFYFERGKSYEMKTEILDNDSTKTVVTIKEFPAVSPEVLEKLKGTYKPEKKKPSKEMRFMEGNRFYFRYKNAVLDLIYEGTYLINATMIIVDIETASTGKKTKPEKLNNIWKLTYELNENSFNGNNNIHGMAREITDKYNKE